MRPQSQEPGLSSAQNLVKQSLYERYDATTGAFGFPGGATTVKKSSPNSGARRTAARAIQDGGGDLWGVFAVAIEAARIEGLSCSGVRENWLVYC